ncbi:Na-translocating system protein MpsC family protein [Lyngbya confervoides]|uniref:DUF2294 domain-containing protein n=1 Tax=Lyngbya confervoides BDU141951 TaxID=1574623 RepID=A0ABD4T0D0_9CYAN|nr:Na-translocating system protein MpsC family protein [Lyngbya confervoides]MCM1981896.1 DUF2294 domain-containing protein [Lyngbya confervoides BDU141951]
MNKFRSIEETLAHKICSLYQSLVGHAPDLVTCQFLNQEQLVLIFQNAISPVEQLLFRMEQQPLAKQVRSQIDLTFHEQLIGLVEKSTQRSIIDLLSESKIETGRKSIILVLKPAVLASSTYAGNGSSSEKASEKG